MNPFRKILIASLLWYRLARIVSNEGRTKMTSQNTTVMGSLSMFVGCPWASYNEGSVVCERHETALVCLFGILFYKALDDWLVRKGRRQQGKEEA